MAVTVRTTKTGVERELVDEKYPTGAWTDFDPHGHLVVYDDKDNDIATIHRDHWTSVLVERLEQKIKVEQPSDEDINRLAQTFYAASGITLPSMTDKPMTVRGLRAVFERLEQGITS